MANLASANITVTVLQSRTMDSGRKSRNLKLVFGDGVLTYPAGGVPVTGVQLGCPNSVESLVVYDGMTGGYVWSYDAANGKLFALQSNAGPGVLAQPSAFAIAAQSLRCEVIGW